MKKRSVGSVSCHQRPCSVCSVCFRPLFDYFDRTASEKGGRGGGGLLGRDSNLQQTQNLHCSKQLSVPVSVCLLFLSFFMFLMFLQQLCSVSWWSCCSLSAQTEGKNLSLTINTDLHSQCSQWQLPACSGAAEAQRGFDGSTRQEFFLLGNTLHPLCVCVCVCVCVSMCVCEVRHMNWSLSSFIDPSDHYVLITDYFTSSRGTKDVPGVLEDVPGVLPGVLEVLEMVQGPDSGNIWIISVVAMVTCHWGSAHEVTNTWQPIRQQDTAVQPGNVTVMSWYHSDAIMSQWCHDVMLMSHRTDH